MGSHEIGKSSLVESLPPSQSISKKTDKIKPFSVSQTKNDEKKKERMKEKNNFWHGPTVSCPWASKLWQGARHKEEYNFYMKLMQIVRE